MKRLITAAIAIIAFSASNFAMISVVKSNRGLFGYRTVSEDHPTGPGGTSHFLACANPGSNKCNWTTAPGTVTVDNGEQIVVDDLSDFEIAIEQKVRDGNLAGTFYHGANFFVKYTYDDVKGSLAYEIYSLYEAQQLGLI